MPSVSTQTSVASKVADVTWPVRGRLARLPRTAPTPDFLEFYERSMTSLGAAATATVAADYASRPDAVAQLVEQRFGTTTISKDMADRVAPLVARGEPRDLVSLAVLASFVELEPGEVPSDEHVAYVHNLDALLELELRIADGAADAAAMPRDIQAVVDLGLGGGRLGMHERLGVMEGRPRKMRRIVFPSHEERRAADAATNTEPEPYPELDAVDRRVFGGIVPGDRHRALFFSDAANDLLTDDAVDRICDELRTCNN